jgi:hypothetical protein
MRTGLVSSGEATPAVTVARRPGPLASALRHFGLFCLIGLVPYLMMTIFLGQMVTSFSRASHNQALVAGLLLALYVTPILLRPASQFMRRNMTYWRPEAIDTRGSMRFRFATLIVALGIIPWLVLRYAIESLLLSITTLPVDWAFSISSGFAAYFTFFLLLRAAPEVKRLLYPELLSAPASVQTAPAKVTDGDPAVDRRLVDVAELPERRLDVGSGELAGQFERVHADTGEESDLIAKIMPTDADLALVAEPRPQ